MRKLGMYFVKAKAEVVKGEMRMNKRIAQLIKRAGISDAEDKRVGNMPDDYKTGYFAGWVAGREAQRNADIKVIEHQQWATQ